MPITTVYDPAKPSLSWKKILIEFLRDEFLSSEVHITFSPLDLTVTWEKDKIIQITPMQSAAQKRYKELKDGEVKVVMREVMEANLAVLCKTGEAADDISDRLQAKINGGAYLLGAAELKNAYTGSPIFDPFVIGKLAVSRHIHRIRFEIETY